MLLLDALARRYNTDPYTIVTTWEPERLTFNVTCLDQAKGTAAQLTERITRGGGWVFPVVDVGGG